MAQNKATITAASKIDMAKVIHATQTAKFFGGKTGMRFFGEKIRAAYPLAFFSSRRPVRFFGTLPTARQ